MEAILFYVLASIIVISALLVILAQHPIHNALWLVITFLSLAALYVMLHAEFLAVMQVLIYAGAIIILVIFAVFIISFDKEEFEIKWHLQTPFAYLVGGVLIFELFYIIKKVSFAENAGEAISKITEAGNTEAIAVQIFSRYVLPFEIASVLLLAAMIGAVVIAKEEKE